MFVMFDTVTVQDVPSFANTSRDAVAGYIDGRFANEGAVMRHDPLAHHLTIATNPAHVADVLDIETGDAIVEDFPGWWHMCVMAGIWRPCAYHETSGIDEVFKVAQEAHIHRAAYRLWSAHFTNIPHVESGSDATQWTDRALGRNLDESLCLDSFLPAPRPAPHPATRRVDVAELTFEPTTGHWSVSPRPAREVA